ncbi:2800_t:CDS:2 [Funneliformis mosseae]|uniref:2800_t:CDS:1 n=1 Tax=Funneliformis mosseae TaxID=27381 RepID=A0A9N9BVG3_FUNMO|nr:2800_t:CDS:2 [Funneliformis mosseae]
MATSSNSDIENGVLDESIIEEMGVITQEIENTELEIAKQHIRAFKPIYEKRRNVLKRIPKFWSQVLMKQVLIGQYLDNDDYSVVQYINDVTVEMDENSLENFKIILRFLENEYFKNKELIKEFIVDADGQRKIKSTTIEWFEGRDYTKKRKVDEDDDLSFIKWFSEESIDENSWDLGRIFKDDLYPQAWTIYNAEEDDYEDLESDEGLE